MVRLHVVNDQVIELPTVQDLAYFLQVSTQLAELDRVHQRGPLIHHQVGIVGDPLGQRPDVFEQVGIPVVDPNVVDAINYFHYYFHIAFLENSVWF